MGRYGTKLLGATARILVASDSCFHLRVVITLSDESWIERSGDGNAPAVVEIEAVEKF